MKRECPPHGCSAPSFRPIGSTFALNTTYGDGGELGLGWTDLPFDIPNHRAENGPAENHVRIGWLRSVANIYHGFAAQSFASELAHASGRDSVEYLLELIGPARIVDVKASAPDYDNYGGSTSEFPLDTARMRRVLELAAEKADWGKRKLGKGSGMGIAVHRSFLTYVATVVEVEVDDKGEVKIPSVHTAVDAGIVVNPEATRAQFEGAAVFGTSIVRSGAITAKNGIIEQSNFNDYPVARMNEAPVQNHRPHRGQRRAAGRCRRARSAAVRARALQCNLRRHRKTDSRIAAVQESPDRVDPLEGAPSKLRLGGVFSCEASRPLPAGNRPDDNKWLLARRDRIGERGIGRLVREVFLAGEEAQEGAALLRVVVANGPAQHGIARLECIENGTQSSRSLNVERNFAADVRQVSEMEGEDYADHHISSRSSRNVINDGSTSRAQRNNSPRGAITSFQGDCAAICSIPLTCRTRHKAVADRIRFIAQSGRFCGCQEKDTPRSGPRSLPVSYARGPATQFRPA